MNVGFIGVGYMGYGIAKNILKKGNNLFVIANKKREPIDKIVSDGAKEVKSYNELCENNLDLLYSMFYYPFFLQFLSTIYLT